MSAETRILDILHTALVGRANREQTIGKIMEMVGTLYKEAKEEGYNEGHKAGHDEGYDEGHEDGYEAGFDVGKEKGRNEGIDIASSRIREYGYGIPYPQRLRAEKIARGNY